MKDEVHQVDVPGLGTAMDMYVHVRFGCGIRNFEAGVGDGGAEGAHRTSIWYQCWRQGGMGGRADGDTTDVV